MRPTQIPLARRMPAAPATGSHRANPAAGRSAGRSAGWSAGRSPRRPSLSRGLSRGHTPALAPVVLAPAVLALALAAALAPAPAAANTASLPVRMDDLMAFGMLEAVKERLALDAAFAISTAPFELSNDAGLTLRWTGPAGQLATARAEIIGSYSEESTSFLWAWGNDTVPDTLRPTALALRDHAGRHGLDLLLTPLAPANLAYAERLAAVATLFPGVDGIYAMDWTGGQIIFLGLHDIEVTQP